MDDAAREDLVLLLEGGRAGPTAGRVFHGLAPELRARRPAGSIHSVWELLEHMRLAQEDILRYTLDAQWVSPAFPEGYWPSKVPESLSDEVWRRSLETFRSDLEEVKALVRDPGLDLTARIPHGGEHTYLREVLLVAEHNAYHLGQVVELRRRLGAWPPAR